MRCWADEIILAAVQVPSAPSQKSRPTASNGSLNNNNYKNNSRQSVMYYKNNTAYSSGKMSQFFEQISQLILT